MRSIKRHFAAVVKCAHPIVKMDIRRRKRIGCRVVPAIAHVLSEMHKPGLQLAHHPRGPRRCKKAHHVDHVRAIAEHHRPRAKLLAYNRSQRAQLASANHLPRLEITRVPAARVFDRQQGVVCLCGFDHAVRVLQGRGNGLFAQNRLRAPFGGGHRYIGMRVVRRHHADQIRLLFDQHFPVIRVRIHLRPHVAPLLAKRLQHLGAQIAHAHHFRLWVLVIRCCVRSRHRAKDRPLGFTGPTGANAGQSYNHRAIRFHPHLSCLYFGDATSGCRDE